MLACACGGWLEPMLAFGLLTITTVIAWLRAMIGGAK